MGDASVDEQTDDLPSDGSQLTSTILLKLRERGRAAHTGSAPHYYADGKLSTGATSFCCFTKTLMNRGAVQAAGPGFTLNYFAGH